MSDSSKRKHDEPVTKQVIVLNYPGKKVPEVIPVYDHDILVEGFTQLNCMVKNIMSEQRYRR